MDMVQVLAAQRRFSAALTMEQLKAAFAEESRRLGFDSYVYALRVPTNFTNAQVIMVDGYPEGWVKRYFEAEYIDAGLGALIQARRNEALGAIAEACGGPDSYRIRREGLGNVKARYVGNFQLTPSCNRSRVIVFKCTGAEPKPVLRK
ncbi:MAG: autoinducer binding domain-containing protein [Rhodoferax sp.]|nr:autoinducer binding domain-containing protein [Rhodoferax sp.]